MKPLPLGLLALGVLGLSLSTAPAADWYVTGAGDDAHAGTSLEAAFRTLKKAAAVVQPGDTVNVGNGTFPDPDSGEHSAVLPLATSGRPDAWITWRAIPGTKHEIRPTGWHGILVRCSYQILDGLTVMGNNDSIFLAEATIDGALREKNGKKYPGNPYYNTNGISIEGRQSPPDQKPHHVIIRHCTIGKCAGGGVSFQETDYGTVEDCFIYENAWFMRYGGSGVSTLNNWAFDDAPGYHNVIQRNKIWNNKTLVPWLQVARHSDGNGIILDVSDQEAEGASNPNGDAAVNPAATPKPGEAEPGHTPVPPGAVKPVRPEWKGRTLVANNLCVFSGGSGIHAFRHRHADIINNTTYCNGNVVGYPELFANNSDDIVILNNVIVPRPAGKVTSNNKNGKNVRWDYNVYPKAQNLKNGEHDIVADPEFVNVDPDWRRADFHLAPGSPALDSGTDELPQPKDLLGNPRPAGKGRDRGAFEQ